MKQHGSWCSLFALTFLLACDTPQSEAPQSDPPQGDAVETGRAPRAASAEFESTADVEATLEALYAAFAFDAGGEADWEAMRALFASGAAFVAPIADGTEARAQDADGFLADFRKWVRTSPEVRQGLHERILKTQVDGFGNVAHAWVAFEGFVPSTGERRTRGLDSIQLVRSQGEWKVVSFTSHYGSEERPLPGRFLR